MAVQPPPLNPLLETRSLVRAAIEALSPAEINRLRRYAYWRMLPIRGIVHHSDENDLYNEAVRRTLDGTRKWNSPETTMFQHLLGCISSIADEWYKEMKRYGELSDVQASADTVDAQVTQKVLLQRVRRQLKGDAVALAVFESLLKDEKPSEAVETLSMSKRVYEAARRRVLRRGQMLLLHRGAHDHE
jgi:hypothetical protein